MLQTLFYIPCELFGRPVLGFGLLLAAWAAASAVLLAWLVRRQGFNANTRGYVQVLAVLGAAIAFVLPLLCEPRGLPIRGYGMMMLLAVLSGMGLAVYRARRVGVDPEMIFTLAFWLIVPGILGARAVYVTEYWREQYWRVYLENGENVQALLFAIVNVAGGGLVVYGALFGAMLGLGLFWWRHRIPLLATADLIAPSMLLGLALGRVGCLLNGCCYGGPCDLSWKVTFPWNSPAHQHEVSRGTADVLGLKFRDGPHRLPIIAEIAGHSPAFGTGLAVGMEIDAINGVEVASRERSTRTGTLFGCSCAAESVEETSKERAACAVLAIDKLDFILRGSNGEVLFWTVDDPPERQTHGGGLVKIYGLEIAGNDDQAAVISHLRWPSPEAAAGISPAWLSRAASWVFRRQSPEASAGIHQGQRVAKISGREVHSIGQLRQLLDEHRQHPWLDILPAGGAAHPTDRRSPLAAEFASLSDATL